MKREILGYTISFILIFVAFLAGNIIGESSGYDKGVNSALDSINSIVTRQVSDTAISSKFLIQSTDTVEFILNAKTIKMK